jgi:hypothetical protein
VVAVLEGKSGIPPVGFLKPGGVANKLASEKEVLRNEVRLTVSSRDNE